MRHAPTLENAPQTMFFVLGAQKAGTSWLHKYLAHHPQVSTGPIKEYSYFGYFHRSLSRGPTTLPPFQRLRRLLAEAALRRRAGLSKGYVSSVVQALRQVPIYKNLLQSGRRDCRAFGDISPKYSLLDRAAFSEMAALHPKTKFVFIMRDPIDRIWSQIRMGLVRHKQDVPETAEILRRCALPAHAGRTDYARLMAELEAAVPSEDILYLFYETLFSDASISRLCDHLGIVFLPGDYGNRVFAGRSEALSDEVRAKLRLQLDPQYRAVMERFGPDLPPWNF